MVKLVEQVDADHTDIRVQILTKDVSEGCFILYFTTFSLVI